MADLDTAHRVGDDPVRGIEFRRHRVAGNLPDSLIHALLNERRGADGSMRSRRTAVPEREQQPPDVGLG